jgi:hypothetical protein
MPSDHIGSLNQRRLLLADEGVGVIAKASNQRWIAGDSVHDLVRERMAMMPCFKKVRDRAVVPRSIGPFAYLINAPMT